MRYVVDTNIFNRIADGKLGRRDFPEGGELVATHIQENEIRATKNERKRVSLLGTFELHQDVRVPDESMAWVPDPAQVAAPSYRRWPQP